ncbi:hypothetical protein Plo01_44500 [Planobispora longispora]|uniref:Uncharacterized protein n=2 Tax=Planobispora longispora TaxID=28887 RepID=A0A8J3RPU3_9ACTN|nr:hypothetical protein Plo01_44500 [Planobispora longispora]
MGPAGGVTLGILLIGPGMREPERQEERAMVQSEETGAGGRESTGEAGGGRPGEEPAPGGRENQPPLAQSPDAEPEGDAQPGAERDWLPSHAQSPDDME